MRGEEVRILWDNTSELQAQMRDDETIVVWHGSRPHECKRIAAAMPARVGGIRPGCLSGYETSARCGLASLLSIDTGF